MPIKKSDISFTNSVARLQNRVAVPKYYFEKLPEDVHSMAFYVSEMNKAEHLQKVLDSLNDATEKGLSFDQWKNRMRSENIEFINKSQEMAVYRNNTNIVYNNSTRFNAMSSRVTPYLCIKVVGDGRTRPDHLEMHNVCARADSKIWDYYLPPFDHNCRCKVIAVTEAQAKAIGIRHSMAGLPKFEFTKKSSSFGNIMSGVEASIKDLEKRLPKNSKLKKRFEEKILESHSIVDILVQKQIAKFMKGLI